MQGKNRKSAWRWEILLFAAYLAFLFYFLLFADRTGRGVREYHYNLVLFREIRRFWTYRRMLGIGAVALNLFGNVAAFLPLGALLPGLFRRCRNFFLTALLCFEVSLCAEILQLFLKAGCFDVDDLLLNTCGGILGYFGWFFLAQVDGKGLF